MKRSFKIELFKEGEIGKCYTVNFTESELNEAEIFEKKYTTEYESYYRNINSRLKYMLDRHKFKPPWLELEEGKRDDRVVALKTPKSKYDYGLRWYGLLCTESILILGNGGLKTTNTYQEDENLHNCVKDLQYVDRCLNQKLNNKDIVFDLQSFEIKGHLNFPKKQFKHIEYPKD